MKKYMITAAAFLLVAGMANAQAPTKETVKNTTKPAMTTSRTSTPHKAATVSAAPSGTPSASTQKQSTASTTIKRKHHTKKANALKKTVNK
jgi:hypothetical protein